MAKQGEISRAKGFIAGDRVFVKIETRVISVLPHGLYCVQLCGCKVNLRADELKLIRDQKEANLVEPSSIVRKIYEGNPHKLK